MEQWPKHNERVEVKTDAGWIVLRYDFTDEDGMHWLSDDALNLNSTRRGYKTLRPIMDKTTEAGPLIQAMRYAEGSVSPKLSFHAGRQLGKTATQMALRKHAERPLSWTPGNHPAESGYYMVTWSNGKRLFVSELWFNKLDKGGQWWASRGYLEPIGRPQSIEIKDVIAYSAMPEPFQTYAPAKPVAKRVSRSGSKCSECKKRVVNIIGCPDGAEICQECFDAGLH